MARAVAAVLVTLIARAVLRDRLVAEHDLLCHPMMALWPRVGNRWHDVNLARIRAREASDG